MEKVCGTEKQVCGMKNNCVARSHLGRASLGGTSAIHWKHSRIMCGTAEGGCATHDSAMFPMYGGCTAQRRTAQMGPCHTVILHATHLLLCATHLLHGAYLAKIISCR